MRDVILHAFNWRHAWLAERAAEIAGLGYGAVLVPPPLYSDEDGPAWWQRYQPRDYRVLRSWLGGRAELEDGIRALHAQGVRVLVDVVFNHMANERAQRADALSFPGERVLSRYRAEREAFERDRLYGDLGVGLFSPPWDFHFEGEIGDWTSPHEATEHSLSGLPDLELNDWVVEQQRTCLRALRAMGVDGFRVDAIKHLPAEHFRRVFEGGDADGCFVFGEALTSNEQEERLFLWPLLAQTRASFYDFALHDTVRRALGPGGTLRELVDPEAFGQALPRWRAVTFSITHDIPLNDCFRGQLLDRQDEYLANAWLLGRDGGVPLVYTDQNESAAAHPEDRDRWAGAWRRADIAGMISFHNAVHGAPQRTLFEDDGLLLLARGERGIVALNKTAGWRSAEVTTWGLGHGRWRCQLHGHELAVGGDRLQLAVPPREAQLWLLQDA